MKLYAITDSQGKVVGTVRMPEARTPSDPDQATGMKPRVTEGRVVHEIEADEEKLKARNISEFHQRVAALLPKQSAGSKKSSSPKRGPRNQERPRKA